MCAECKKAHDFLLGHEDSTIPSERIKDSDIFNDKCTIHPEYPLDIICSDCNSKYYSHNHYFYLTIFFPALCCLKCKTEGEHKKHNTVSLNECQGTLKKSLESYMASLEEYQAALEKMPQKADEILREAENRTNETAELIRQHFNEIRAALDRKEKEILESIKKNDGGTTAKLIDDARKLREEVPTLIDGIRSLLGGWDSTKLTAEMAGKALSIKQKVSSGKKITDELKILEKYKTTACTEGFVKGLKRGLDEINAIDEIPMKKVLRSEPVSVTVEHVSSAFVILSWNEEKKLEQHTVSMKEEGGEWENIDGLDCEKERKKHFVHPLKPDTTYYFRVMGRGKGVETRWSEVKTVKTKPGINVPLITNQVRELQNNLSDALNCERLLGKLIGLSKEGKSLYENIQPKVFLLLFSCRCIQKGVRSNKGN